MPQTSRDMFYMHWHLSHTTFFGACKLTVAIIVTHFLGIQSMYSIVKTFYINVRKKCRKWPWWLTRTMINTKTTWYRGRHNKDVCQWQSTRQKIIGDNIQVDLSKRMRGIEKGEVKEGTVFQIWVMTCYTDDFGSAGSVFRGRIIRMQWFHMHRINHGHLRPTQAPRYFFS